MNVTFIPSNRSDIFSKGNVVIDNEGTCVIMCSGKQTDTHFSGMVIYSSGDAMHGEYFDNVIKSAYSKVEPGCKIEMYL